MSRLEGAFARLNSLLRRRAAEARMNEEFEFHVAMQTEKNMARGMEPAEARRNALLAFGGVDAHRESLRDYRRTRVLGELIQDLRFTMRSLRSSRGFALTAVLVIALGVGATTALFSVANALLFKPLRVSAPGELYILQEVRTGTTSTGPEGNRIPWPRYEAYRDATSELFTGLAAHVYRGFSMRTEAGAVPVQGSTTSGNYFQVLGLRPALGRFYSADDEPVIVLGDRMWKKHFGGDAGVIGRRVHLDGQAYEVIGVAPPSFIGTTVGLGTEVWVPFRAGGTAQVQERVGMFGRMRDDVTADAAAAPLSALAVGIPPENPQTKVERAYLAPLTGLPERERGMVGGFMGMLVAAGFLVLLIAAANIAALLLARGVARQREMALRLALGAGRWRLVRQLLTESTTLFLIGGIGGIVIAYIAAALISRISIPGAPIVLDVAPDVRVLAFALGVAALTGILFGLAPALGAVRPQLTAALKEGSASAGSRRGRGRSIFVGGQLAFATLLLITAGLFVRGLQRGIAVDPGFNPDGVVVGTINLEPHGHTEAEGRALRAELLRRVRALPGVRSAALANIILLTNRQRSNDMEGTGADAATVTAALNLVDTAYFNTLGVELVAGRGFTGSDHAGSTPVVVVNETLAERLWPGRSPLGERLRMEDTDYSVIGVARDGRYVDPGEAPRPFAFFADAQEYSPDFALHARMADGDGAEAVIQAIREELRTLDPDVALEMAMPLPTMIGFSLIPNRFAAALIGVFGLLGLVLAGAGVYGVMAFHVAQRTREFGIRIALGASASTMLRLVVRRGAVIAAGGALVGILLAAAVTRFLTGMLFGLSPLDPVTFAGVAAALAAVALLASWLPARRALRTDPAVALRSD